MLVTRQTLSAYEDDGDPSPPAVPPEWAAARLDVLEGLPSRARYALRRAGAKTVADAVELWLNGELRATRGVGKTSLAQFETALRRHLARSGVQMPEGLRPRRARWEFPSPAMRAFIRRMGPPSNGDPPPPPDRRPALIEVPADDPADLLALLPEVIDRTVRLVGRGPRDREVLRYRYGLDGRESHAFRHIGQHLGVTPERVRQLHNWIFARVREALCGEHDHRAFQTPAPIRAEFVALRELLAEHAYRSGAEIEAYLGERYRRALAPRDRWHLPLLLELLGWTPVWADVVRLGGPDPTIWMASSHAARREVADIVRALRARLRGSARPVPLLDLTVEANAATTRDVPPEEVASLVSFMKGVETLGDEGVRLRLPYLKPRARQAERILREEGEPLHLRDITRRINQAHEKAREPAPIADHLRLGRTLSKDDAFEAIGRSGNWRLAEWAEGRPSRSWR